MSPVRNFASGNSSHDESSGISNGVSKFVHLHVHTHYSLLDGMGKIPQLLDAAKEMGMEALAITDHGVMYGALEFYQQAKVRNIKPIIGMEAYVAPRGLADKVVKLDTKPSHLTLLVKNQKGYLNLIKLTTVAHLEGHYYKPRIDKNLLAKHSDGLIALSGCQQGEIARHALADNMTKAKDALAFYKNIFGDDFYLEVQRLDGDENQKIINERLIRLGKETRTKVVATKDVHYIKKDDREAAEILLCVQTGKTFLDNDRMRIEADLSLLSGEEMADAFEKNPEVIENTAEIANKCNLEIELGQILLPPYEVKKGKSIETELKELVYKGLEKKYKKSVQELSKNILKRTKHELGVIKRTGFASYFLIVADFVNYAKDRGIMVGPGRGSAAGSIVSYALNITDIDPIKYDLLFERFLNEERMAMPDIDMDFADNRRAEVIEYVIDKYGANHVAQIITFGTMMARGAIRDVGRALGLAYSDVDKIAKMIPFGLHLVEALSVSPELKKLYQTDESSTKLIDLAIKLEGVARHASTHAAGVVISPEPLIQYVPLQKAVKGSTSIVTQYAMGELESLGLLKMDFLGLSNLSIIGDAIGIIKAVHKLNIDIDNIPLDDHKTFSLLGNGKTTGVFQLESDGMKRVLKNLKPTQFEDIIAVVALYRPGPMQWIDSFIKRKHGKEKVSYPDPKLKNALEETYGIPVYQEQVMQIAKDIAGFSGPQADILRKAMGKKIKSLMMEQKKLFIEGAKKNGFTDQKAKEIFALMEDFAQYGFNKSHAACYAMIAYWTAYLKTHYPNCFMAALLTSDQQNMDRVTIEAAEAERMKIEILPPDVNESFQGFAVVPKTNKIRFGLWAIKNVGEGPADAIVEERKINGPFETVEDLVNRLDSQVINKKPLEALIRSGALDSLEDRGKLLANLDKLLLLGNKNNRDGNNGQTDMLSLLGDDKSMKIELSNKIDIDKKQIMAWEKELLGMYITEHPLKDYEDFLRTKAIPIGEIETAHLDNSIIAGGVITNIHKILTRSKEMMVFAQIEDTTGKIEVLVFPKMLAKNLEIWQEDNVVLVKGRISSNKEEEPKIVMEKVRELTDKDLKSHTDNQGIIITLDVGSDKDKQRFNKIKKIIQENSGPVEIIIQINQSGQTKKVKLPQKIKLTKETKKEIEKLSGNKIEIQSF